MSEVRVRHSLTTRKLYERNQKLSDAQRERIQRTHFKFLLDIPEKVEISGVLLRKLLQRWDESSGGFRVGSTIVPFTPLDVCLGVGLPIVGIEVNVGDGNVGKDSHTENLLRGKDLKIKIVDELLDDYNGEDSVEEFFRLYMLIGFATFLMPKTTDTIDAGLFRFFDDLDCVNEYAWGNAVYSHLVSSLSQASTSLRQGKNSVQLHITGCAALLQMWACEHLCLYDSQETGQTNLIPRVWKASKCVLSKKKIEEAFTGRNLVIKDLSATSAELQLEVVQQAFEEATNGYRHWCQTRYGIDGVLREHAELKNENAELRAMVEQLQGRVVYLETELVSIKQHIQHSNIQPTTPPFIPRPPSPVFNAASSPVQTINGDEGKSIDEEKISEETEVAGEQRVPGLKGVNDDDMIDVEEIIGTTMRESLESVDVGPVEGGYEEMVEQADMEGAVGVVETAAEGYLSEQQQQPVSTIGLRLKNSPRKRERSQITKTPFTTIQPYVRRKKKLSQQ